MLSHWILDENKNHVLCDPHRWATFIIDGDRGLKSFETKDKSLHVSTAFIGIDLGFGMGPPLLYETMIFCRGEKLISLDGWKDRYSNRAHALQGHRNVVRMVIKKLREDKDGTSKTSK